MKRSNWMKVNHDILKFVFAALAMLTVFLAPASVQERRARMVNPARQMEAPQRVETRTIELDQEAGKALARILAGNNSEIIARLQDAAER